MPVSCQSALWEEEVGGEGREGKGRRYSLANFKLDQMGSSEGLGSGLGYQVGRESMLVCLGRPVNVVCTRVRVLCLCSKLQAGPASE